MTSESEIIGAQRKVLWTFNGWLVRLREATAAFATPQYLNRYLTHALVLALMAFVVSYADLDLAGWPNVTEAGTEGSTRVSLALLPSTEEVQRDLDFLAKASNPLTSIPERPRRGVITYRVQRGDNLTTISERFGLHWNTLLWSNDQLKGNPDLLYTGEELFILPVDGVYHEVKDGDTLASVAEEYQAAVADILESEYNNFANGETLAVGQWLVVPGGTMPINPLWVQFVPPPPGAPQGSGNFIWPVSGQITQSYWTGHLAVDIGRACGTPVYAAESGYVSAAGWSGGYGNRIILTHGRGWDSLYGHLQTIWVRSGASVQKGSLIGYVGNTGRSTGCHLHLELREYGVKRNPLGLLLSR